MYCLCIGFRKIAFLLFQQKIWTDLLRILTYTILNSRRLFRCFDLEEMTAFLEISVSKLLYEVHFPQHHDVCWVDTLLRLKNNNVARLSNDILASTN